VENPSKSRAPDVVFDDRSSFVNRLAYTLPGRHGPIPIAGGIITFDRIKGGQARVGSTAAHFAVISQVAKLTIGLFAIKPTSQRSQVGPLLMSPRVRTAAVDCRSGSAAVFLQEDNVEAPWR